MVDVLNAKFIAYKLQTDQRWLESALLAVYRRQTEDEKKSGETIHHNERGFNTHDAPVATYMAKWLLGDPERHLSGRFLKAARTLMPKYAAQLVKYATNRARQEARSFYQAQA